jgi:hypothetical protein
LQLLVNDLYPLLGYSESEIRFSRLMAKKARGLTKSLHSPEHAALCGLLLAARRKAGLTQQVVAKAA